MLVMSFFAAPAIVLLPLFLAARRIKWWSYLTTAWLSLSLILIALLEFATPQFLYEYDSRPNRLFIEYLVYPREVFASVRKRSQAFALSPRSKIQDPKTQEP